MEAGGRGGGGGTGAGGGERRGAGTSCRYCCGFRGGTSEDRPPPNCKSTSGAPPPAATWVLCSDFCRFSLPVYLVHHNGHLLPASVNQHGPVPSMPLGVACHTSKIFSPCQGLLWPGPRPLSLQASPLHLPPSAPPPGPQLRPQAFAPAVFLPVRLLPWLSPHSGLCCNVFCSELSPY